METTNQKKLTDSTALPTPSSKEIERMIRKAYELRKMIESLWDTSFEIQFGDDMDNMLTNINSVIAYCAPILGWAKAGEIGNTNR
ncbi:MAG: hypothetical protein HDS69_06400 [Bacteroidales bacterium]|nr:hypothetical protein [Bacteroidales bacterium]